MTALELFGLLCLMITGLGLLIALIEWVHTRVSTDDFYDLRADLIRRINESHKDK